MDRIIDMEFINQDILQKGTPHYVQQVEKFVIDDEADFFVGLRLKGGQDVRVDLPNIYLSY
jgi:hypothetical protein